MVLPTVLREARGRARADPARLARRTTFGIGGTPEFFFEPASEEETAFVVAACRRAGIGVRVLGGGSNLLVDDRHLEGAVLSTRGLRMLRVSPERVEVGAGRSFARLVGRAPEWRIPVLPACPGIPGTVGGAVAMNAGGRAGAVGEALVEIHGLDEQGRHFRCPVAPGDLAYRRGPLEGRLLTRAVFRRDPGLDPACERQRLREALEHKRRTQPLGARSAGCVFRNPVVDGRPLPAGRLLEEAGLKGRRAGGAVVSPLHANFVLNEGDATAEDVRTLIRSMRDAVRARHGIELELELHVWS